MNILMLLEGEFKKDERVRREAITLVNHGHEVTVAYTVPAKSNLEFEEFKSIKLYRKKLPWIIFKFSALALSVRVYFKFWYRFIREINRINEFDIIHVHDLPLAEVGIKTSRDINAKLILDFHENRPQIMRFYHHTNTFLGRILISLPKWDDYERYVIRNTDYLILVTPEAKLFYVSKYNLTQSKICVVPNYIKLGRFDKFKYDNNIIKQYANKFMVMYFGDTSLRRGTNDILEAANILKEYNDIHFVIVGYNNKEQVKLEKKKETLKLDNVELTGYLPIEKAVSYMKASKCGLSPIHRNIHHDTTYPNKIFQFMYYGKPVIVSNCPAQAKIIEKEKCGYVFKAGDICDLAGKILDLKMDKEFDLKSKRAKQAARNSYNWEKAKKEFLGFYSSINV